MPLTKTDKNWIDNLLETKLDVRFNEFSSKFLNYINATFAKQSDLEEVKTQVAKIDRVVELLDQVVGNQKKQQDEEAILSANVSDHEERIQALESK